MTMTFKEALIAHLQGQKVQASAGSDFRPLLDHVHTVDLEKIEALNTFLGLDFRLAPRTILVNGVEVPAPEKCAPKDGDVYFVPQPDYDEYAQGFKWTGHDCELRFLSLGLVYIDKESAIARAKAMLITQEVK